MKNLLVVLLAMVMFFGLATMACAVGPYMKDPHTAAWNPNSEADLGGYYLYWRPVTTPVTAWDNSRRAQVAVSATPTYNLLNVITSNGSYEIAVTAYDTAGNESGLSNIVPFVVDLPGAPANNRIQAP